MQTNQQTENKKWVSSEHHCRAFDRQHIRSDVAFVRPVPLNPDELGLGGLPIARVDLLADGHNQILVGDLLPLGVPPLVLHPLFVPRRHAVDCVLTVGAELAILRVRNGFQCS